MPELLTLDEIAQHGSAPVPAAVPTELRTLDEIHAAPAPAPAPELKTLEEIHAPPAPPTGAIPLGTSGVDAEVALNRQVGQAQAEQTHPAFVEPEALGTDLLKSGKAIAQTTGADVEGAGLALSRMAGARPENPQAVAEIPRALARSAQQTTESIQNPVVRAVTPIAAGIAPPMLASAIPVVGPGLAVGMGAIQTGGAVYNETGKVGPALAAGTLGGAAGMLPGGEGMAGAIAHGAETGATFDVAKQVGLAMGNGQPIDLKQTAGSAAFGAVLGGGMHALRPPTAELRTLDEIAPPSTPRAETGANIPNPIQTPREGVENAVSQPPQAAREQQPPAPQNAEPVAAPIQPPPDLVPVQQASPQPPPAAPAAPTSSSPEIKTDAGAVLQPESHPPPAQSPPSGAARVSEPKQPPPGANVEPPGPAAVGETKTTGGTFVKNGPGWEKERARLQTMIEKGKAKNIARGKLQPFAGEKWADDILAGRAPVRPPSENAVNKKQDMVALKRALFDKYGADIADQGGEIQQLQAYRDNRPELLLSDDTALKLAQGDDSTFSADDVAESLKQWGHDKPEETVARLIKRGILKAKAEATNAVEEGNRQQDISGQPGGAGGGGGAVADRAQGGNAPPAEVGAGAGEEEAPAKVSPAAPLQPEERLVTREEMDALHAPTEEERKLVGVGPASVTDPAFEYGVKDNPTSIKNAVVDKERVDRGLQPAMKVARRSFGDVWDSAMKEVEQKPNTQDELISELRAKPRALSDREDALILHRQIELQNDFAGEAKALEHAQANGDQIGIVEHRARAAALSDQLLDLYNVGKSSGTETGRGLNARRMMAQDDFTLAAMETRKRAANEGKPLTPQQSKEMKTLHDRIQDLDKKVAAHEAGTDEAGAQEASKADFNKRKLAAARSAGGDVATEREAILKAVKKEAKGGTPPTDLRNYIQRLAENFVRGGIKDREPLIDAVHGELVKVFPEMTRRETMDAISGYGDFKQLNPDAVKAQLRDLKGQMQQVGKLQDMAAGSAPSKTGIERRTPSAEERRLIQQVNEAKKRGGFIATDPATQLKTALETTKTRLKNQISDLEYQVVTGTKLVKNRAPTPTDAAAEALKARRDALQQQYDQIFGPKELTDQQRVKLAIDATNRSVAEYERRIKEGDLFPAKAASKTPQTPELLAVQARRDALREELQHLQDVAQPKKTAEQIALQAFKTRTAARIAELQEKLARDDFSGPPARGQIKLDPQGQAMKAQLERYKQLFEQGVARDRLKQRTPLEKVQDAFTKWRRAALLSSPVTLAKLTSAAAERMAITPGEELIGGVIGKVIPGVSSRAPREGGASIRAEAQAITEGWTKGSRDAWQTLRTGKSDLDVLYGKKGDGLPPSAIDFIGNLHGALKSQTKRNEFARAFQKRTEWAMRNNLDPTDPTVQTRIAVESYKDANRSIFMQDNRVVSIWKHAQGILEAKSKETGRVPTAAKAGATVMKTLVPIVKVPTNIVAETMQYAVGTVTGGARLARAYGRGIDTLKPGEADLIMRSLKKGSVGAAVIALGYFGADKIGGYYQPGQKRDQNDVKFGAVRMFGVNVPSYLVHNPLLECLQIGATVRRVADSRLRKRDAETQGIGAGAAAAALGVTEEVPFVRETLDLEKVFDPYQRNKLAGEYAKSLVVPAAVDFTARQMDKDASGETVQRKPESVLQAIQSGIPKLREGVPEAGSQRRSPRAQVARPQRPR